MCSSPAFGNTWSAFGSSGFGSVSTPIFGSSHPVSNTGNISIKLPINREKNKVLFAESDGDFVDVLFSLLTLPMGTIIRLLGAKSNMGSMDKLYNSVANLDKEHLKTQVLLLLERALHSDTPFTDVFVVKQEVASNIKLEPRIILESEKTDSDPQKSKKISLKLVASKSKNKDEEAPLVCLSCDLCNLVSHLSYESQCPHGKSGYVLEVVNPKSPTKETTNGGGFMKDEMIYMVTDTLDIKPLSPLLAISLSSTLDVAVHDIEEHVVHVGEEEALKLLEASLTSKSVLNDVFALELEG
ncbi:hypothetical protein IFM89_004199 [Coptis chinensis]|uniref:DUF674 domain-containing protein n=1 Tax=Coptis chinensis TaxID=261450 RepID=A0A835HCH9_9MAGN|nr:hypothetical protein IFM89_004199 [Coptis chinensis]